MARSGTFAGPVTPFGVPTPTVHPSDNNIVEDPTRAEAERVKALQETLYEDIKNVLRDKRKNKP